MATILYIAAALILIQYIMYPIALRVGHLEFAEPQIEQIPIENLPAEVKSYFDAAGSDFQMMGFVPCAVARLSNPTGSAELFILIWFHWNEGISGSVCVAYMKPPNEPPKLFSRSVTLVTRYSETTQFETTTSGLPPPTARMSMRPIINLPNLDTLSKLLPVHLALAAKFHPGKERLLPAKGQELAMMRRMMTEYHAHQIQAGRWALDETGTRCRLTWKGAIINGWQFAWPIKSIRTRLVRKEADRILASLNLAAN
jgi:hypothetical protein